MAVMGLLVLAGTAMSLNRTYESLEASRAGAQSLVQHAPDAVFVADLSGQYTDVNDAGCRMVGYSRDEILAMTIVDLLGPEDAARLPQQREELLKGVSQVSEWTLRRKDGGLVPVEISAKIFADGRWQGLVRDISDRKRLESELRAAEAEQKFLADFGSALVSTIDDRETVDIIATRIARELADVCVVETIEEGVRQRKFGSVVRLQVNRDMPQHNLQILMSKPNTTLRMGGSQPISAHVSAASSDVVFSGNGTGSYHFFGRVVGQSLTVASNVELHYDESLGTDNDVLVIGPDSEFFKYLKRAERR